MDDSSPQRPRGRPNDEHIDKALIEAAAKEFLERGYHVMTMESVAARAGVSKVSLYRRWNSKSALVADVFQSLYRETVLEDHGSLEADLRALFVESIGTGDSVSRGTVFLRTMGEISRNSELLALYRTRLLEPRIAQLRTLVDRARGRGELGPEVETDPAVALIAGPIFLYYLALLTGAEVNLSNGSVDSLVQLVLHGIGQSPHRDPNRPIG